MNCPYCDCGMESGHVEVHGTDLGFLVVGLSYSHLWFKTDSGAEEIAVPHKSRFARRHAPCTSQPQAYSCGSCGSLVIKGQKAN